MEAKEAANRDRSCQKRILIVDDHREFRGTLRDCVESLGYGCAETDSAPKALEILENTHFPIVISDILMPEMDGLELLRAVKKRHPNVDVLIIMGYKSEYSLKQILQAGASDLLTKPFTMEQLGAKLYKIEREKALKSELYFSAIMDELTGVYNRRYFYQKLKQETERARRQGHPLSIIMMDVDGFKGFNDRYGHLRGDALLRTVATVLRLSLRENVDCAFRYGGDEFVVILPEADGETALSIGNRIKTNFKDSAPGGLTLSMGVAEFQKDFDTETFVRLVDEKMYREKKESKEAGLPQLEVDLGKDNYYIRCLNCGGLVHWASNMCESCLCDPRKKRDSEKSWETAERILKKENHLHNERRATPRIKLRKTFLYNGFLAMIQNISQGGIQMRTKTSLPVGKTVKMAFSLGDGIGRFGGSIAYARSLSDANLLAGVKFTELSDKDSRLLRRFLDSHFTQKT